MGPATRKVLNRLAHTSSQASPSNKTVAWKTYRNKKFGFAFAYPPSSTLHERSGSYIVLDVHSDTRDIAPGGSEYDDISISIYNSVKESLWALPESEGYNDIDTWFDQMIKDRNSINDDKETILFGVGLYHAVKIKHFTINPPGSAQDIFFIRNSTVVNFSSVQGFDNELARNILSTFNFYSL